MIGGGETIVCVSEKNRIARTAHLWTPVERTVVIENGVDIDEIVESSPQAVAELRRGSGGSCVEVQHGEDADGCKRDQ